MITPNLSVRAEYLALALTDSTVLPDRVVPHMGSIDCIGFTVMGAPATRQCKMSFRLWEQIARLGYVALKAGRPEIITGLINMRDGCPLLAQSGHSTALSGCLLSGE
jgi:hypothetical protein